MPLLTDEKYSFKSKALSHDDLAVVEFTGTEGLSRPYEFDVLLASDNPNLDLAEVMSKPATLTIHRPQGDVAFHGRLKLLEQKHSFRDYVFYRAVLAPRFSRLARSFHNQIFLDMNLPDILTAVLRDGGLEEDDFELRLQQEYPAWEYVCQYQESHFAFVSRWMERDGLYYWFEQGPDKEKLIITDSALSHTDMPHGGDITYSPVSGLDAGHAEEVVQAVSWRRGLLPKEIELRDYNYRRPSLDLTVTAPVKPTGRGRVYIYGEHFRTPEEGTALAAIRAEELLCRETEVSGSSRVPFIRPGYTFTLKNHFRQQINRKYLTVKVRHQGSQAAYLTAELKGALTQGRDNLFYGNEFEAIEADRQFRPLRPTPKPKFRGAMNARIDAAGSGEYAELDDAGRYKVILPFDSSGRRDGKASTWLRMMQPYGGSGHGMHFPLRKGTEVILTFVDGDPDRPVIAGAVPNPETPSPVSSENQTMNAITTSSGNKIHMEDKEGSQRILMQSPTADSFVRIGAPNDPDGPIFGQPYKIDTMEKEKDGIKLVTAQGLDIQVETSNSLTMGESISVFVGPAIKLALSEEISLFFGHVTNLSLLAKSDAVLALHWKIGSGLTKMEGTKKKVIVEKTTATALQKAVTAKLKKLQGDANKVKGSATKLTGQTKKAIGAAADVKKDAEGITAECRQVTGELTEAVKSGKKVAGEITELAGQANTAVNDLKDVVAEATTVAGDATEMAQDVKSAAVSKFNAHGIDSRL